MKGKLCVCCQHRQTDHVAHVAHTHNSLMRTAWAAFLDETKAFCLGVWKMSLEISHLHPLVVEKNVVTSFTRIPFMYLCISVNEEAGTSGFQREPVSGNNGVWLREELRDNGRTTLWRFVISSHKMEKREETECLLLIWSRPQRHLCLNMKGEPHWLPVELGEPRLASPSL